jgi:hypothetical protein
VAAAAQAVQDLQLRLREELTPAAVAAATVVAEPRAAADLGLLWFDTYCKQILNYEI